MLLFSFFSAIFGQLESMGFSLFSFFSFLLTTGQINNIHLVMSFQLSNDFDFPINFNWLKCDKKIVLKRWNVFFFYVVLYALTEISRFLFLIKLIPIFELHLDLTGMVFRKGPSLDFSDLKKCSKRPILHNILKITFILWKIEKHY